MSIEIIQAQLEHLETVTLLFDRYRVFYQQTSDPAAAQAFIEARLHNQDSVIFIAQAEQRPVGFTQLYPSFSSVNMAAIWILNDLYVEKTDRRKGIARALMTTAATFARTANAVRLVLATQMENTTAQALYESLGYQRDEAFYHYSLTL